MTKPPAPKNFKNRPNAFSYLMIIALIGASVSFFFTSEDFTTSKQKSEKITISEFLGKYKKDEFKKIEIENDEISGETFDEKFFETIKEPSANSADLGLNDENIRATIEISDTSGSKMWTNILIGVAPFLLLILFLIFISRKASGGMGGEGGPFGFGKSKAKVYDKSKHKTKFADVAGADEAKEDVTEVVDFLKNPKKYQKAGAKIPKGILLAGPPGTGKTLLARAIAGEASVPFFSVSGAEFVEMFVGVGASRVRDLFKTAKQNAPAIIFIDEIDAIGKQRGSGGAGGHDEREQTLNQILTEMDGFESGTSVIVMGATNRPDVLDKALLRPGRFDRRVMIDLPDMDARLKILKVHGKNKKIAASADMKKIASKTVGFSGADLENVLNEATIMSVKDRAKTVSGKNLDDAVEKVSMGPERKSRKITEKEKNIIAHHEVGHAIAGHFSADCDPVEKITIISRGMALGVTWFLPEEDTYLNSESKMRDEMVSLHGGRVAERIMFGQTTTGASNDLERCTGVARAMVMTYGMGSSKLGPVVFQKKNRGMSGVFSDDSGEHSELTAREIDDEVRNLVVEAEEKCEKILKKNLPLLKKISEDLLKKETITRKEFEKYFETN
jgi:cell division protease FtsH